MLAKLGEWSASLLASIADHLPGWIETLKGWGAAAWQWIVEATAPMLEKLGEWSASLLASIADHLPGWIETLKGWGGAAWQWIVEATAPMLAKLGEWSASLLASIADHLPGWIETLKGWGAAAWQWIVEAVPVVIEKLGEWAAGLIGWLADKLPDFIAGIYGWATALVSWIGDAIPKAIDSLTQFVEGLGKAGDSEGSGVFLAMVGKWVGLLIGWVVTDLIPKVGPAFVKFAIELVKAMGKIAISLGELALAIGGTILDQLLAGMKAGWDAVLEWFGSLKLPNLNPFSQTGETQGANPIVTVPGYATGTNFARGGLALVGEQGPELINLPRGAQIHTATDTRRLLSQPEHANLPPVTIINNVVVNNEQDIVLLTERMLTELRRRQGMQAWQPTY